MARTKEIKFFSRPGWRRKLNAYEAHFAESNGELWRGESTPGYFWTPSESEYYSAAFKRTSDIAGAVKETLGAETPLLLSLRHPVDRAISAFYHHFRYDRIEAHESILEAGKRHGIIDQGFYKRQYEAWTKHFPASQIHVCFFDDIYQRPEVVWEGLCRFLNIDVVPLAQTDQKDNVGLKLALHDGVISVDYFADAKPNRRFARLRDAGMKAGSAEKVSPVVTRQEAEHLHSLYSEDIAFTMSELGGAHLDWDQTLCRQFGAIADD